MEASSSCRGATPSSPCSSPSEDCLQSADKRRRYMRRGSKTSLMMRGSCCAFMMELQHPKWRHKSSFLTKQSIVTTTNANKRSSPQLSSTMDDEEDDEMTRTLPSPTTSCCDESEDYLCSSPSSSPKMTTSRIHHNHATHVSSSPRLADVLEIGQANETTKQALPLFNESLNSMLRRQTTVSLVTSALELSYIDDAIRPYMEL